MSTQSINTPNNVVCQIRHEKQEITNGTIISVRRSVVYIKFPARILYPTFSSFPAPTTITLSLLSPFWFFDPSDLASSDNQFFFSTSEVNILSDHALPLRQWRCCPISLLFSTIFVGFDVVFWRTFTSRLACLKWNGVLCLLLLFISLRYSCY